MKKILINGGCGFLGSNLASYGIKNGYDITVFDNLSRLGSSKNLEWLRSLGNFTFIHGDTRNKNDLETVIKNGKFDAVFHLAGQVAMTTSIENPYKDFEINAMGAVSLLDSIRKYSPGTAVFFSSTNKVYGDLEQYDYEETATRYVCRQFPDGFDESVPLDFRSPYGCSKGAADQYMLDYHRIFGIKTTVFRHSSMYGARQFATYDQGWVGWFVAKALGLEFATPDRRYMEKVTEERVRMRTFDEWYDDYCNYFRSVITVNRTLDRDYQTQEVTIYRNEEDY